jgi:hypothetical protein
MPTPMSAGASPSPFSVMSVLTDAERAVGLGASNISFHRPAHVVPDARLPLQRIPRHIVQTGSTWQHALRGHSDYVGSWLRLNPEYEYSFFGDEHARRFVDRHGLPHERDAYRRILTGSQRADLFRVIFLKVAGGVYADLDEELRHPLTQLLGGRDQRGNLVPRDSSAIIGSFWPFEFLLYVPRHPIMIATARQMSEGVLQQVEAQRNGSKRACKTPHECIIRVTGPLAYTSGVGEATIAGGCGHRGRLPPRQACATNSKDELLRSTFICANDVGTVWNSWSCGFARHWDCRNSERRRKCHAKHYARATQFFDLS